MRLHYRRASKRVVVFSDRGYGPSKRLEQKAHRCRSSQSKVRVPVASIPCTRPVTFDLAWPRPIGSATLRWHPVGTENPETFPIRRCHSICDAGDEPDSVDSAVYARLQWLVRQHVCV